jgi:glycerol-3-phosphate acyltransferase PlsX
MSPATPRSDPSGKDPSGGTPGAGDIVISIDAMGGDRGVGDVLRGMDMSLGKNPRLRYILHGDAGELEPALGKAEALAARTEEIDVDDEAA